MSTASGTEWCYACNRPFDKCTCTCEEGDPIDTCTCPD